VLAHLAVLKYNVMHLYTPSAHLFWADHSNLGGGQPQKVVSTKGVHYAATCLAPAEGPPALRIMSPSSLSAPRNSLVRVHTKMASCCCLQASNRLAYTIATAAVTVASDARLTPTPEQVVKAEANGEAAGALLVKTAEDGVTSAII
jgi:hypothetical protein